jgi:hypothetical protein
MVKRSERHRGATKSRGPAFEPYQVLAAENAPRRAPDRAVVAAILVFLGIVVGPPLLLAIRGASLARRSGWELPEFERIVYMRGGDDAGVLSALIGVMLFVGAYWLTDPRHAETISGELRLATRLAVFASAATFTLVPVMVAVDDHVGWDFFVGATGWTLSAAQALLALAAARHFERAGRRGPAIASRLLAAALPAASVATYLLKRTTYDDMRFPVSPRHAYLVLPISLAVWMGKLAVFGMLYRVLSTGTNEPTSSERAPRRSRGARRTNAD